MKQVPAIVFSVRQIEVIVETLKDAKCLGYHNDTLKDKAWIDDETLLYRDLSQLLEASR